MKRLLSIAILISCSVRVCWLAAVVSQLLPPLGQRTPRTNTTTGQQATDGELIYATESMGNDNFYFLGGLPPAWSQLTNDRLIRYNYNNEPEGYYPMLAEKFEFSADYLAMDVYLRQGVQWQGGYGEFTADDVEYTFDTLQRDAELFLAGVVVGSSGQGWLHQGRTR